MTDGAASTAHSDVDERYTIGYSDESLAVFRQRSLAVCAPFVLPHLRPGLTVLDVGCGPGSLTIELAERVTPGQVIGVDIDDDQFEAAHALATARGVGNVRFERADAAALSFSDNAFDVVFSHGLISHVRQPAQVLAEMYRVTAAGGLAAVAENDAGTFVISPADSAMERFLILFLRVVRHNGGDQMRARHLRGALLAAGFARVEGHAGLAEVKGTLETTRQIAVGTAAVARSTAFVQTVLSEGWASSGELAMLPDEMLAWGERADAYWSQLKCGALGWKL
jgi:ubiquinone/menaquinone biosynthesis C-methylase UbiE